MSAGRSSVLRFVALLVLLFAGSYVVGSAFGPVAPGMRSTDNAPATDSPGHSHADGVR
ncbi:hypothetical protein [Streptomyces sp. NPDC020681]|uniref:hypothetical protein n=1 Tax=Streptomyces sp. NPDC020681 TaxID=3365083 RepID=UPI003787F768